jgi:hypothetical protein
MRCCDDDDGDGYSECEGDTNDADPTVNPGATEVCDGLDNNSDGSIDEGCDTICDEPEKNGDDANVSADPAVSRSPSLVWTGIEYGVSWRDDRDGNHEIYFARLDASGTMIVGDVRVTTDLSNSYVPTLLWTGIEYGASWQDDRDGNHEIYFARLDSSGTKIGDDVRVTADPAYSQYPSMVWTGSEYGVSWYDERDGNYEIYFARLDSSGTKIGGDVRVTNDPSSSFSPSLVWTGSEYGVSWDDYRDGNYEIYFARLDASGAKIGGDVRVTDDSSDSRHSALVRTGSEYGVSWHDDRDGYNEVYFARLDASGVKIGSDVRVTAAPANSVSPSLVWTGSEYGVSWQDLRDGYYEIYFAQLRCCDDVDGDTYNECHECNDADPQAWYTPSEAEDLLFASDRETMSWDPPLDPGGTSVIYDTLRSGDAQDFGDTSAVCVESDDGSDTIATDSETPGEVFYYLVRAENACGHGLLGQRFDGERPAGRDCP